jgi:molecular chaperone DnaK (HSP70)
MLIYHQETSGGYMRKLVHRNTQVPTRKSQNFSTAIDNQSNLQVRVFAGESAMASDNFFLGHVELTDIPLGPSGYPQIEITMELDVCCS